jgi:hypothetical protein
MALALDYCPARTDAPAVTLPPEDSPVWVKLEDDVVAEREPNIVNFSRMRGAVNAPKRRALLKSRVARYGTSIVPQLLIFCGIFWLFQFGLFLYWGNKPFSGLLWAMAGPPAGMLAVALPLELQRRRFTRAVASYAERLAEADSGNAL